MERYNTFMALSTLIEHFFVTQRFRDSFKSSLAFILAFGLALALNLNYPMMSSVATVVLSLSTLGESMVKSVMRAFATLFGVFMGLSLIALFPQYIWSYLFSLSIVVGFFSYFAYANKTYSYFFFLTIFTTLIVWDRANTLEELILFAFSRMEETYLGIIVFFLVNVFIWPKHNQNGLENQMKLCFSMQHQIFNSIVTQEVQKTIELKHNFREALFTMITLFKNALFDSMNIYALKENYKSYIYLSVQIKRTLYGLHTLFQDSTFTALRPLISNENDIFKQINHLFCSNSAQQDAVPIMLRYDRLPKAESNKVYLDLYAHYLKQLQTHLIDRYRLLQATREYRQLKLSRVSLEEYKSNWVWFDHDALRVTMRVMITFYFIVALWISLDMQGGFLIVAYGVGYTIVASALFPFGFKRVLIPYNISALIALLAYCIILVNINTYYALALFLFSYVFATNFIFTGQRKTFHMRMLYPIFLMDLANHQIYDFGLYFNALVMFEIILVLVSFGSYFPFNWRAETLMVQLQQRYTKQCASLLRYHHTYLTRQKHIGVKLYYNYLYSHVLNNVDKMQQYADNIDYAYFNKTSKEELQTFITLCRDFSFLCKELHISEEYGFFKKEFQSFTAYRTLKDSISNLLENKTPNFQGLSETTLHMQEYNRVRDTVFDEYKNSDISMNYASEVLKRLYIYERLHLKAMQLKQMQHNIAWHELTLSKF